MNRRELVEFEARARSVVAVGLRGALDQLTATLTAVYVNAAGSTRHKLPEATQTIVRDHLLEVLGILADHDYANTRKTLYSFATHAINEGARTSGIGAEVSTRMPLDVRHAMRNLTAGMREDLRQARQLARGSKLDRYGDLVTILAQARRALNRADRAATWIVHRAHNEGVKRAVDKAYAQGFEVTLMWRAEQDACVACLGFAGALAEPGHPFAPIVSVEDSSARPDGPVWGPPLHPNCRCEVEPWVGSEAELTTVDLPHALRREAQRSIAAGRAQGSVPARLRAADRLVQLSGKLLIPKTVQKRAREAVKAGSFQR